MQAAYRPITRVDVSFMFDTETTTVHTDDDVFTFRAGSDDDEYVFVNESRTTAICVPFID